MRIGCRSYICCIRLLSTPTNTQHLYINSISYVVYSRPSTLLQLQNPLRLQTQYNQYIKMFTYLIVTVDKIQSTKRCQLSTVIITVHGSY